MYFYIANPIAGKGKLGKIINKLKQKLHEKKIFGEFIKTTGPGDAKHLAHIALKKGYSTIIAIGGDGLCHEIQNAIAGEKVVFGTIPTGHHNRIAQLIGMGTDWEKSIDLITARRVTSIPLGYYEQEKRFFVLSIDVNYYQEEHTQNSDSSPFRIGGLFPHQSIQKTAADFSCTLRCDDSYWISQIFSEISILNLGYTQEILLPSGICPSKKLQAILTQKKQEHGQQKTKPQTVITAKKIHISSKKRLGVTVDGFEFSPLEMTIHLSKLKQKVIFHSQLLP